ncbi:MAG: hypothetical protein KC503_37770 [Myxococcales bacterium]|nr:hypothetical protein [Myxococcales bacterium]
MPPFYTLSGNDVDILLVVDNSGSMGEAQHSFVTNLPSLINALRHPDFGPDGSGKACDAAHRAGCRLPNMHLGVISTDLGAGNYALPSCEQPSGDGGRLLNKARIAGCQPPADRYVAYIEGLTNIPGGAKDSAQAFIDSAACISRLGIDGCGFEHPFEAMYRALQPNANPGFLREHASLLVIFLGDEDDCSASRQDLFDPAQQSPDSPLGPLTSFRCFEHGFQCDQSGRQPGVRTNCKPTGEWLYGVDRYVDLLRGLKRAPQDVIVGAIAGPSDKIEVALDGEKPRLRAACSSAAGSALPAIRTHALVSAFAPHSHFASICEADYGPALERIGALVSARLAQQRAQGPTRP